MSSGDTTAPALDAQHADAGDVRSAGRDPRTNKRPVSRSLRRMLCNRRSTTACVAGSRHATPSQCCAASGARTGPPARRSGASRYNRAAPDVEKPEIRSAGSLGSKQFLRSAYCARGHRVPPAAVLLLSSDRGDFLLTEFVADNVTRPTPRRCRSASRQRRDIPCLCYRAAACRSA